MCAKLFPSHAPIAHKAVARLQALGWTEGQIATYLRKEARDPALSENKARHPLPLAVWLAEKSYRKPPVLAPPPAPSTRPRGAHAPPTQQAIATRLAREKQMLALLERAGPLVPLSKLEKHRAYVARLEAQARLSPDPSPGGVPTNDTEPERPK